MPPVSAIDVVYYLILSSPKLIPIKDQFVKITKLKRVSRSNRAKYFQYYQDVIII